jgi:hypothetical protein
MISRQVKFMALYFASTDERETEVCFLVFPILY